MALAAATIADRGRMPRPTLVHADKPRAHAGRRPPAAEIVARGMREVVEYGTGTAAAIEGVTVAGKTGTAELRQTQGTEVPKARCRSRATRPTRPRGSRPTRRRRGRAIAVAVMLVEAGRGRRGRGARRAHRPDRGAQTSRLTTAGRPPCGSSTTSSSGRLSSEARLSLKRMSAPFGRPLARRAVRQRVELLALDLDRPVGEGVRLADPHRDVLVLLRVDDREARRGRHRLLRLVLDAHPDPEPDLVGGEVEVALRHAVEVGPCPLEQRVQLPRDLHLVLDLAELEVDALGLGDLGVLALVGLLLLRLVAAGGDAEREHGGEQQDEEARGRHGGREGYNLNCDAGFLGPPAAIVARRPRSRPSSRIERSRASALRWRALDAARGANASISRSDGYFGSVSRRHRDARAVPAGQLEL